MDRMMLIAYFPVGSDVLSDPEKNKELHDAMGVSVSFQSPVNQMVQGHTPSTMIRFEAFFKPANRAKVINFLTQNSVQHAVIEIWA